MSAAVHRVRLLRASLIVAVLIAGVALSASITDRGGAVAVQEEGLSIERLGFQASPWDGLARAEELLAEAEGELSEGYLLEAGLAEGARDIRVAAGGKVVSYVLDRAENEALAEVEALFAERGWSKLSLGGVKGATFVKDSGTYRWLVMTCTQFGSSTSVVIRGT